MKMHPGRPSGFTLIEVLVVIAIILILARMLLPALSAAKKKAYDVHCTGNLHQLSLAFILFAHDHSDHLPGNWFDSGNADPDKRDWLCNTKAGGNCDPTTTPMDGTLFRYVSNNKKIYLCPLRDISLGAGTDISSNGFCDYAASLGFSGAKLSDISPDSIFTYADGSTVNAHTPLLVEESGAQGINGWDQEGGHANSDQMSHNHRDGSYYASVDGSVQYFKEPLTQTANNWTSLGPKTRTQKPIGPGSCSWGYWDTQ